MNVLANVDGAVRVHDLSTWPERQKLFVFCTEPVQFEHCDADLAYV